MPLNAVGRTPGIQTCGGLSTPVLLDLRELCESTVPAEMAKTSQRVASPSKHTLGNSQAPALTGARQEDAARSQERLRALGFMAEAGGIKVQYLGFSQRATRDLELKPSSTETGPAPEPLTAQGPTH